LCPQLAACAYTSRLDQSPSPFLATSVLPTGCFIRCRRLATGYRDCDLWLWTYRLTVSLLLLLWKCVVWLFKFEGFVHFYYSCCQTREHPKPNGCRCGCRNAPVGLPADGFSPTRGFACRRFLPNPHPHPRVPSLIVISYFRVWGASCTMYCLWAYLNIDIQFILSSSSYIVTWYHT